MTRENIFVNSKAVNLFPWKSSQKIFRYSRKKEKKKLMLLLLGDNMFVWRKKMQCGHTCVCIHEPCILEAFYFLLLFVNFFFKQKCACRSFLRVLFFFLIFLCSIYQVTSQFTHFFFNSHLSSPSLDINKCNFRIKFNFSITIVLFF